MNTVDEKWFDAIEQMVQYHAERDDWAPHQHIALEEFEKCRLEVEELFKDKDSPLYRQIIVIAEISSCISYRLNQI